MRRDRNWQMVSSEVVHCLKVSTVESLKGSLAVDTICIYGHYTIAFLSSHHKHLLLITT